MDVDSLSDILNKTKIYCPVDELEILRNNYNELFYYKNNNIDIPCDFYNVIYTQTKKYFNLINFNQFYSTNSTINYKINILRFLFKGFNQENDINKQVEFIFAIFNNLLLIIDN